MDMFSKLALVRRKDHSLLRLGLRGSLFVGLFTAAILGGFTSAQTSTSAHYLTPERRVEIEKLVTSELQGILNRMERTEGQRHVLTVKIKFDPTGQILIIDPGKGFLDMTEPYISARMEQQMQEISQEAVMLLEGVVEVSGTEFRFDGKDIYHYFPEEWRPILHLEKGNHLQMKAKVVRCLRKSSFPPATALSTITLLAVPDAGTNSGRS